MRFDPSHWIVLKEDVSVIFYLIVGTSGALQSQSLLSPWVLAAASAFFPAAVLRNTSGIPGFH
jgi:hypothetical protein